MCNSVCKMRIISEFDRSTAVHVCFRWTVFYHMSSRQIQKVKKNNAGKLLAGLFSMPSEVTGHIGHMTICTYAD